MPRPKKVPAPPQLPTTLANAPPRRKLLDELQTLNRFGPGWSTALFEWVHGISVWLDNPEDPAEDNVVDVLSISPKIEEAIIRLPEETQRILRKRMDKCGSSYANWTDNPNAARWRLFVKSVGSLENAVIAIAKAIVPIEPPPPIVPDFGGNNSKWKPFLSWAWDKGVRCESPANVWQDAFRDYANAFGHVKVGRKQKFVMPKNTDLRSIRDALRKLLLRQGMLQQLRTVTDFKN